MSLSVSRLIGPASAIPGRVGATMIAAGIGGHRDGGLQMHATLTAARAARPAGRRWFARSTHHLGAFGITATLGLGALGALAGQCDPPPPSPQDRVIEITNARRADHGLAPVRKNADLMSAAQAHSRDQAAMRRLSHTGSDGSDPGQRISRTGYRWSTWAENIAAGQPSARDVMSAWMGSDLHRANILSRSMVHIGVGLAYARDGTPYWTMVLARPD